MTDELYDRITEILDDASTESGALAVPDEDDGADDDLLELAEEAADILEETDPKELLEAVGLGTLEDGTEPETVPEAITEGKPEHVEELQRLVRLAKLADRSEEDELGDVIAGLREATGEDGDADSEADDEEETDDEDAESEGDADDEDAESETDDDADRDDDEAADEESADASDELEDRLRDAVGSSFEEFGADLESVRDQLEAAAGSDDGSDEAEEEEGLLEAADDLLDSEDEDDELLEAADDLLDSEAEDDELLDSDDEDEEEADNDEDEDDEDDGLLGSDEGLGSSESSRHSTMAPPPNERADMNAVKRHSTMPKRNR
ncbi:hypothetical protein [Natronococcus occultus]|uniref:Uncharacterized protein n=1 Tax=Natronococcus occultus SP4 TaxID=694430 RepID=L0JXC1_9EURY|nr:hypothetical protein [Natronococcus occultus]AGB36940.1 hypothetical protein Natoc_1102 [Natronococcus occultus SP4]